MPPRLKLERIWNSDESSPGTWTDTTTTTSQPGTNKDEADVENVSGTKGTAEASKGTSARALHQRASQQPEVKAGERRSSDEAPLLPITVFTQLDMGRLAQLEAQCASWPGPLVAALYVPVTVTDGGDAGGDESDSNGEESGEEEEEGQGARGGKGAGVSSSRRLVAEDGGSDDGGDKEDVTSYEDQVSQQLEPVIQALDAFMARWGRSEEGVTGSGRVQGGGVWPCACFNV